MALESSAKAGRVYARAIFELAQARGSVGDVFEALEALGELYDDNREFRNYFTSPKIPREEKARFLDTAFSELPDLVRNLLHLLVRKRREPALDNIVDAFRKYRDEAESRIHVHVTSAAPLPDSQRESLNAALAKRFPAQEVELHEAVDASLIGGLRIRTGDRRVDGSIRTRLENLRRVLSTAISV